MSKYYGFKNDLHSAGSIMFFVYKYLLTNIYLNHGWQHFFKKTNTYGSSVVDICASLN
jgi:hypothetical protein